MTDTFITPLCVRAGTIGGAAKVTGLTFIQVLTMCPVVLKAFPAVAEIGAVSVEAVGESMADL